MKAVPVVYKGVCFRSTLEARWAVFFDLAGLRWRHEPARFYLPGGPYLPDFQLRTVAGRPNEWVEVKGKTPSTTERTLCKELSCHAGASGFVYLVSGEVHTHQLDVFFMGQERPRNKQGLLLFTDRFHRHDRALRKAAAYDDFTKPTKPQLTTSRRKALAL